MFVRYFSILFLLNTVSVTSSHAMHLAAKIPQRLMTVAHHLPTGYTVHPIHVSYSQAKSPSPIAQTELRKMAKAGPRRVKLVKR